jgi:ribose transport system substrate-binding protein
MQAVSGASPVLVNLGEMRDRSRYLLWAVALASNACAVNACSRSESTARVSPGQTAPASECAELPPLPKKPHYDVGFVQVYQPISPFRVTNTDDMTAEARRRGHRLKYEPPTSAEPSEQMARVQSLISQKVDAIVISPQDAALLAPAVVAARRACIPVFTENRALDATLAVAGKDYVTAIGPDTIAQGQVIADWLIKATGAHATILELQGTSGSSPAIGRTKGFDERVAAQPGMHIVASESADFDRAKGHDVTKRLLSQHPDAGAIYAQSDLMALGALAAARELGRTPGKDLLIVSIDGLKEAVQGVIDGSIAAIEFTDPRFGATTFDAIESYAAGKAIPSRIVVAGEVIDRTNAASMLARTY